MGSFDGQAAIVTGASRGIGLAIARALLDDGARVCLTARRAPELEAAAVALGAGERVLTVSGASHDPAHRADAVRRTLDAFGSIDLLVNNAATNPLYGPLVEADLDAVRTILDVNVVAPVAWAQAVWSAWMGERGGAILNVASLSGIAVETGLGPYGASKAALVQLTRQLAIELAPRVRVNAVAPAVVRTRFARALYEDREEEVAEGYPLGRLGAPEDVAHAVRYLLGAGASWITGQTLVLDGGITLTNALSGER
jgi:3-oxoacyl-[acyl-carrier protein] reductase